MKTAFEVTVLEALLSIQESLQRIDAQNRSTHRLEMQMKVTQDQMLKSLQDANDTTNEIADDITKLIAGQSTEGLTAEEAATVQSQLEQFAARLKDVAAEYTPPTPPTA